MTSITTFLLFLSLQYDVIRILLFIDRYSFCRLTQSVVVLLILCGGLHLSHGEKLKCEFKEWNFGYGGTVYSCDVKTSLDNSFNNMTIDGFTGTHLANKNDNDVKVIYIYDINTKYIPANLGFLFHLTVLLVRNSSLIEIKAENFHKMQNLEYLSLYVTKQ